MSSLEVKDVFLLVPRKNELDKVIFTVNKTRPYRHESGFSSMNWKCLNLLRSWNWKEPAPKTVLQYMEDVMSWKESHLETTPLFLKVYGWTKKMLERQHKNCQTNLATMPKQKKQSLELLQQYEFLCTHSCCFFREQLIESAGHSSTGQFTMPLLIPRDWTETPRMRGTKQGCPNEGWKSYRQSPG